jgi:hypothetical protein
VLRHFAITTCLAGALAVSAAPNRSPKRTFSCKTAENSGTCYWVHGRLGVYDGNPTYRLWKIGTHHLFGILSGPGSLKRNPDDGVEAQLPDNISFHSTGTQIFGDFEICPLQREVPGEMQNACIESAKKLVYVEP